VGETNETGRSLWGQPPEKATTENQAINGRKDWLQGNPKDPLEVALVGFLNPDPIHATINPFLTLPYT